MFEFEQLTPNATILYSLKIKGYSSNEYSANTNKSYKLTRIHDILQLFQTLRKISIFKLVFWFSSRHTITEYETFWNSKDSQQINILQTIIEAIYYMNFYPAIDLNSEKNFNLNTFPGFYVLIRHSISEY